MTHEKLEKVEAEIERFRNATIELRAKAKTHYYIDQVKHPGFFQSYSPKESGALRRVSMDLTRALAEFRNP
jgi:hypothetical protein